jgi:hypothetical protein
MAVYFLDAHGVERIRQACKKVLDAPVRVPPDQQLPYYPSGDVHHAVLVTSSTPTSGRYPAKLQYRDEATPTWSDFDPSVVVWAVGYNGEALVADTRYDGEFISFHTDDLAVFVVTPPGGAAGGTFVGVRVRRTSNVAIASGSTTIVSWQEADFDTDSFWNVSNPHRIVVPSAGYYMVGARSNWTQNATGQREIQIVHRDSANTLIEGPYSVSVNASSAVSDGSSMTASGLILCSANDRLEVYVRQESGGDLNLNAELFTTTQPSFWVFKVGDSGGGGGSGGGEDDAESVIASQIFGW